MTSYTILVQAEPKGQPRARAKFGGKGVYNPSTADGFKSAIMAAAHTQKPLEPILGPVRMTLVVRFPRPKSHYGTGKRAGVLKPNAPKWHTSKPDRDNVEKVVLDALTRVGFWRDDSVVCCGEVLKVYANDPSKAGCVIFVDELSQTGRESPCP